MYDVTLNLGISNIDLESAIRMILFANSKNHQYKDGSIGKFYYDLFKKEGIKF